MSLTTTAPAGAQSRYYDHALDAQFRLDAPGEVPEHVRAAVTGWLHWVDNTFSMTRPDSLLSQVRRHAITLADCPQDVLDLIALCSDLTCETAGYFSIVSGGVLDPSGVAKGWATHYASRLLTAAGCRQHCLRGGRDIWAAGEAGPGRPWRLVISHPMASGTLAAIVTARDCAVATSVGARRHVVDPTTDRPVTDLASVTVVGPDLVRADAYATAAIAMGRNATDWLAGLDRYGALVVGREGRVWQSANWHDLTTG